MRSKLLPLEICYSAAQEFWLITQLFYICYVTVNSVLCYIFTRQAHWCRTWTARSLLPAPWKRLVLFPFVLLPWTLIFITPSVKERLAGPIMLHRGGTLWVSELQRFNCGSSTSGVCYLWGHWRILCISGPFYFLSVLHFPLVLVIQKKKKI